jgi:hypothetical protein
VFFLDSLVDYGSWEAPSSFGGHSEDYFLEARFCLVEGYVGWGWRHSPWDDWDHLFGLSS